MNERIKELAAQCHRPVLTADKRYLGETFDHEKFAELIVKECANVAASKQVFHGYDVSDAIKEHFGVE